MKLVFELVSRQISYNNSDIKQLFILHAVLEVISPRKAT